VATQDLVCAHYCIEEAERRGLGTVVAFESPDEGEVAS